MNEFLKRNGQRRIDEINLCSRKRKQDRSLEKKFYAARSEKRT